VACVSPTSTLLAPSGALLLCIGQAATLKLRIEDACETPVPLANTKILLCAKRCSDDEFPTLFLSTDDPTQILVVEDGLAYVFFKQADTVGLDPGNYIFDVWLIFPVDQPFPLIKRAQLTLSKSTCIPRL
jgi:hypothetical protein